MTAERGGPPGSVPTLTEVVAWPGDDPASGAEPVRDPPVPVPVPVKEPPADPAPPPAREPPDPDQLAQRILADVQAQVDRVLEYRVREALTPILARATDAVVREARTELARSLRDVVARSVAEEMRRQRAG